MAKKFVRGITDVKTINNQDFDTNNVNDLLSDGQYNYIHRKKGKAEEYHNLTDNIKTISSDNTDLLTVTNNNKTTNTATLHPKHDAQKEQVIESTRDTITINHGTNGTAEKTAVDTNPQKVLEHEKLKTGDGLSTLFNTDETTIILKPTSTEDLPAKNGLYYGNVVNDGAAYSAISLNVDPNKYIQLAFRNSVGSPNKIVAKYRYIINNVPTEWQQMLVDDEDIRTLLSQKQNKLTAGEGITIQGNTVDTNPEKVLEHENLIAGSYLTKTSSGNTSTLKVSDDFVGIVNGKQDTLSSSASIGVLSNNTLRQLYSLKREYIVNNSLLKTHVKLVSLNTDKDVVEEEYNFILKINNGSQDATFTLSAHDKDKFNNIITAYGTGNAVTINGCLFTLSDSTLTVSTDANTGRDYVITFSDII